jgi:D-alanine transfer protein
LKQKLAGQYSHAYAVNLPVNRKPIIPETVFVNWDSLFVASQQEQINISTNNSWYINNDYYNKHIKGKTKKIRIAAEKNNQELRDFYMLIKLLRAKNANASFVILPINPYYYTNSEDFTPFIHILETELANHQFPCLNFWNPDTATFDHGVLTDVMHLSKYGWYQTNKFIVETYHLAK